MQMRTQRGGVTVAAPSQHCPLYPKNVVPHLSRLNFFVPQPGALAFAALQSHAAVLAQTEARYRIAFDRSRLKRGPPAIA
jgi:hypothetical protein